MIKNLNPEDLLAFEERVADAFNSGKIRAPVHLYSGNETELINVFSDVDSEDWVLCSWRSHYQCLLKGVPQERVFSEILAGRSISLCFADYKIFSSAIVGGVLPIAIGIAFSIKRAGGGNRVHCFLGDMTAETGIAHECIKYATNFDLPIRFIIEDNGLSVCTDTRSAWGDRVSSLSFVVNRPNVVYYKYQSAYPHAGAGVRVQF
jgi:TPP-dependent pyruvate/acetoin dehydrogenase alpha subunit